MGYGDAGRGSSDDEDGGEREHDGVVGIPLRMEWRKIVTIVRMKCKCFGVRQRMSSC